MSDDRDAEIARLTSALAESEADKVALYQEARGLRERAEAAEQKLAAAEKEAARHKLCADHYEKRLIEEQERFAAMVLEFGELKDAAEQKLAAAERSLEELRPQAARVALQLVDAEARVRFLEGQLAIADRINGGEIKARAAAESEQLRDHAGVLSDANEALTESLAQLRARVNRAIGDLECFPMADFRVQRALETLRGPK